MGATDFSATAFGKDAREAFRTAVDQATRDARWEAEEEGDEYQGYSGTIAEKSGYTLFTLPRAWDTHRFFSYISDLAYAAEVASSDWADAKEKKAAKKTLAANDKRPDANTLLRAARAYNDKWGPAVAVEASKKEQKALRERLGYKGRKGSFFAFAGLASC